MNSYAHLATRGPSRESLGDADGDRAPKYANIVDQISLVAVILYSFGTWLLGARHVQASDATIVGGVTSPIASLIWAIIYLVAFVRVYGKRKAALEFARASPPLVLLLVLACLSTLWSDQPALTARRSIELVGTVALAVYFASRLGLRGFIKTLALAIMLASVISVVLISFVPSVGLDPDNEMGWSGMFEGKNFLGEAMIMGMLSTICLGFSLQRKAWMRQAGTFALFVVLLAGSGNGSGAGIAIFLAIIMPILFVSRAKKSQLVALLAAAVLVLVIFVALQSDEILNLFGKDATLTGRTALWELVIDAITQKPVFGYGYAAFWGRDAPAGSLIYPYINWIPGTAHNGFLEVALNCGIVGEMLFIWLLIMALWRSFKMFWQGSDLLSSWPLLAMICLIFKNISEASLLVHGESDWIVFIAAFVFATRALEKQSANPKTLSSI